MEIDEIIEKIESVKPVELTSVYGEDLVRQLDLKDCDDCKGIAEYLIEHDLVREVLNVTVEIMTSDYSWLDDEIQYSMAQAIEEVLPAYLIK
jgi:hypothetical protein